ncbi:2,3,4,5-tetrahydropyridine-2,6-dicarboxylate N-acetyltransferase [bioreactor metagenome]|uniref:2,3,4,5-tetrahydropyridine-2,6-dicarboxylate N-acetyltransferase n=1 Tax=bioreactor metagenome TaxID=1076179 RepID=A0A645B9K5_9ZZZZ
MFKISYYLSKMIIKLQIPAIKNSKIDKTSKINSASNIMNVTIGRYSYVGINCEIYFTTIGNFCSIANGTVIGGGQHPIGWCSTSPVFYKKKNILQTCFNQRDFLEFKETKIGNDVWIGSNCLIKSGIKIGNGAIIGMGSVVTKDVGGYEIWGGNPAKLIRKRFDEEVIYKLESSEWWNEPKIWFKQHGPFIADVDMFLKDN